MPLYREQFVVALPQEHPLAEKNGVRPSDLNGMHYLNRINSEFNGYAVALWKEHGLNCEMAYRSERDDWILAMVASGRGFGHRELPMQRGERFREGVDVHPT